MLAHFPRRVFLWIFFSPASVVILLLLIGRLLPQTSALQFSHYTINEGLSENSVMCILQDSRGFLWFGTGDGLNRFDGYQFKIFKHIPYIALTAPGNALNTIPISPETATA